VAKFIYLYSSFKNVYILRDNIVLSFFTMKKILSQDTCDNKNL